MKKLPAVLALAASFTAGAVVNAQVRDWRDVRDVRNRINVAINDLRRITAANYYDMHGHGRRAIQHLEAAQRELDFALQTAGR